MSDEVEEDKHACSGAESDVEPTLRDLEATSHRPLNVEHLLNWTHLASQDVARVICRIETCFRVNSVYSLSHDSSF